MKAHNIFKKVGSILAEINEQYQYLAESPENLNDIELELLSANADFLAEHIKVLKKINLSENTGGTPLADSRKESNTTNSGDKQNEGIDAASGISINHAGGFLVDKEQHSVAGDVSHSNEYQESVKAEPKNIEADESLMKQDFPESYSSFNQSPETSVASETDAVENIDRQEEKVESAESVQDEADEKAEIKDDSYTTFFRPEVNPVNISEPVSKIETIEETVVNEVVIEEKTVSVEIPPSIEEPKRVPTLNEMISAQINQSAGTSESNKQPVSDIKAIINLNDKLLFIKDLFNGYSLAYSEAIEIINRFDSFDAADNFLKTNYSVKNSWSAKQATADKFYELLNRRFTK